jgi:hypothetical protein
MTFSTFIFYTFITAIVLIFIRYFWKQILIIGTILYILGQLIFWSFIVALFWAAFINQSIDGWGWIWFYCFLSFIGIGLVYGLIIMDTYSIAVDWIRSVLKIK